MRQFVSVAVIALAMTACSSSSPTGSDVAVDSTAPGATGPDSEQPTQLDRAIPDPVAAAVTYVASTDQLMGHSAIGRSEILRKLVARSELAAQAESFDGVALSLADTLGVTVDRLTWVEAPLTATLVSSEAERAKVAVWAVSVLGAPDSGPPQQVWRTVHVDLVLVDSAWLIAGAKADAGPTPQGNDLVLPAAWGDFAEVAGWPAVVAGVGL